MKSIKIKSIEISNFKGIREFKSEFSDVVNIYGHNGKKKSTIANAIFWCLWGKDQEDRKDYEIKNTVDTSLNRLDHSVKLVFDVDGRYIPIQRIYKEKWTKKKGSEESEFTGHVTDLVFDDVPMTQKEFQVKINQILEENIFKLVTNPLYFNSLNWKERRKMLIEMAGEITNEFIAGQNERLISLCAELKHKSIDEYKSQITASKKKINDELVLIPVRVDESLKSKPELQDWTIIENEIDENKKEIESIEAKINDKSKVLNEFYESQKLQLQEIQTLKQRVSTLQFEASEKATQENRNQGKQQREVEIQIQDLKADISSLQSRISEIEQSIERGNKKREELLNSYHEENQKQLEFNEGDFVCPTCNRKHEDSDIEGQKAKMIASFNNKKIEKLEQIKKDGFNTKNSIEELEKNLNQKRTDLKEKQNLIGKLEIKIHEIKSITSRVYEASEFFTPEMEETIKKIEALEAKKQEPPKVDVSELRERKAEFEIIIDKLKIKLHSKSEIEKIDKRVEDLKLQEKTISIELTKLEGILFDIETFINRKMTLIEESINANFEFVRFKMFNTLVNGGTEETCETMLDGVVWGTLNTGGKLKAGIDIINAFCKFYNVTAPMILDNRESVFDIPLTNNQVINLIAKEGSELKVVNI